MNAVQVAARDRQLARLLGAAGQCDRVELGEQVGRRHVAADMLIDAELDALSPHLLDPAIDVCLFHLEVGNAVAQQPADPVIFLEQHHLVAGARQLLRARHASRAAADDCDALAGFPLRRMRDDPAFFPALVDDEVLDRFDADWIVVDVQRA